MRRRMTVADLAVRAGTSSSTIARLEKGEPGVAIGALANILVALGLIGRLSDLIDIRHDDLGLALAAERIPRRGRSLTSARKRKAKSPSHEINATHPDGRAF